MIALLLILLSLLGNDSTENRLPEAARRVLDTRLTVQWTLSNQYFYKCNLNGDSLPDYAVKVTVGKDSCLVEYYVALIAYNQTYAFHLLDASPSWLGLAGRDEIVLRHKGEVVPNYEDYDYGKDEPKMMPLETDAIEFVPLDGCCATIHIFRNGTFEMITSSD